MSAEQRRVALSRALTAFNEPQRRHEYFDLYDEAVVLHGYPPGLPPGIQGVKAFYESVWMALPDCRLEIQDVIIEGDRAAIRYSFNGTHSNVFAGVPATGKKLDIPGQTILRFSGTRVVERWQSINTFEIYRQMGRYPDLGQAAVQE
jgi:predicted ester cyclase